MSLLIPQFINVIAPNNDLLMDELNVIYFAPKWRLYLMIWLPRTTDNSSYFAQYLEIRGIESRLYLNHPLKRSPTKKYSYFDSEKYLFIEQNVYCT